MFNNQHNMLELYHNFMQNVSYNIVTELLQDKEEVLNGWCNFGSR